MHAGKAYAADPEEVSMPAVIRLRTRQYGKIAQAKGWSSDALAAAAIGVHETTVSRIRRGLAVPSGQFIAGLLLAAAPWEFSDLFEVVASGSEDVA